MKIKTIIEKWYFVVFICLQAWWFNLFHIFEDQIIIHMILTFMLCIGIGGSMCYVLFHGLEEQKKRETMVSKEVAEKL
jgi:apolipoprotein N-acyltransferase